MLMITEVDVSESSQFVSEPDIRESTKHVNKSSQYDTKLDIISKTTREWNDQLPLPRVSERDWKLHYTLKLDFLILEHIP